MKPDLRTKLSPYQVKKINKAIAAAKDYLGEYHKGVVPMGTGRKKYMQEAGAPSWLRGIVRPGGTKLNSNLRYIGGEILYERNGTPRSQSNDLDTSAGENEFISSAQKVLKNRRGRKATMTANGRRIGSIIPTRDSDLLISEGVRVFNKYSRAFYANEKPDEELEREFERGHNGDVYRWRSQGNGKKFLQKVAHPSEWGMAVLFEGTARKKTTSRKKIKNAKK